MNRIFAEYFKKLGLPNLMRKSAFHHLASLAHPDELDQEVTDVLDQIVAVAAQAKPAGP